MYIRYLLVVDKRLASGPCNSIKEALIQYANQIPQTNSISLSSKNVGVMKLTDNNARMIPNDKLIPIIKGILDERNNIIQKFSPISSVKLVDLSQSQLIMMNNYLRNNKNISFDDTNLLYMTDEALSEVVSWLGKHKPSDYENTPDYNRALLMKVFG